MIINGYMNELRFHICDLVIFHIFVFTVHCSVFKNINYLLLTKEVTLFPHRWIMEVTELN